MDRNEKKRTRDKIGQHLDVPGTRLNDREAGFLSDLIDNYDETYRGKSERRRSSHRGRSSDGMFIRTEEWTDTFTDDIGIRQDYSYHDDDGQSGKSSTETRDARGGLNWFRDRR